MKIYLLIDSASGLIREARKRPYTADELLATAKYLNGREYAYKAYEVQEVELVD